VTQSTAMGDSSEEYCDTTLLLSALHGITDGKFGVSHNAPKLAGHPGSRSSDEETHRWQRLLG